MTNEAPTRTVKIGRPPLASSAQFPSLCSVAACCAKKCDEQALPPDRGTNPTRFLVNSRMAWLFEVRPLPLTE